MSSFAQNLRRLRELNGLTQAALARMAGMHPTHISQFETGQRDPSAANLAKLARMLGTTMGTLWGNKS